MAPVALVAVAVPVADVVNAVRESTAIVPVSVVSEVRLEVRVVTEVMVLEIVVQVVVMMVMDVAMTMAAVLVMSSMLSHMDLVVGSLEGHAEGVLMVVKNLDIAVLHRDLDNVKVNQIHLRSSSCRSLCLGSGLEESSALLALHHELLEAGHVSVEKLHHLA